MFTGIVETTTPILEIFNEGMLLQRPLVFENLVIGESIAVSGVCLSLIEYNDETMRFDVVNETWNRTTLGQKKTGDYVNLERSLAVGDRFDGHVVQGHVEGVGVIAPTPNVKRSLLARQAGLGGEEENTTKGTFLSVRIPPKIAPFVIPKGSIAIDGVSLTVAKCSDDTCSIALIPHTKKQTTLGLLQAGDEVNIETDMMVRTIISAFPSLNATN